MSKTRSIARNIARNIGKKRTANAFYNTRYCPVCGFAMKDVWYSRATRKCTAKKCGTKIRTPWLAYWKEGWR